MGRERVVALAVVGVALSLGLLPACSEDSCKRGTLSLQILLSGTAPQADTITVADDLSSPPARVTVPRQPDDANLPYDLFYVEVAWPGGYPANVVVHLHVSAFAGATLLGENDAAIRLDPGCTSGHVNLLGDATPDAGAND
jgi:hypothetical protein